MKVLPLLLACVLLSHGAMLKAQDEAEQERIAQTTWHSAVLPGWGQVNNGKWWKVPLIYGALGVSGYYIQTEGALYKGYRDGYVALTDEDPTTVYETNLSTSDVLAAHRLQRVLGIEGLVRAQPTEDAQDRYVCGERARSSVTSG